MGARRTNPEASPNWTESEEINACAVKIKVTVDGEAQDWLLFKNRDHNHPTEIEPFSGAATCIGGIRGPADGRAYGNTPPCTGGPTCCAQ